MTEKDFFYFKYRPSVDILNKHIVLTLKKKVLQRKYFREKIKPWLKKKIHKTWNIKQTTTKSLIAEMHTEHSLSPQVCCKM